VVVKQKYWITPEKGVNWVYRIVEWYRVRTGPGIFVEVLESPGIWTYKSIFLIMSVQKFSHYTSSEIWVNPCELKVCEFIEKILEFDIGKSWNLKCMNPVVYIMSDVCFIT